MSAPRRAAAHPTLLAAIIGALVLAGVIALIVVLGGAGSSSGATDHRAGGKEVSTSIAPSTSASTSVPPSTAAPTKTSEATSKAPATSKPAAPKAAQPKPATAPRSVTYVIKRGDTLNGIASWFHQHGYGAIYERNRHVLGKNPDLIYPGQKITISGGEMRVGR